MLKPKKIPVPSALKVQYLLLLLLAPVPIVLRVQYLLLMVLAPVPIALKVQYLLLRLLAPVPIALPEKNKLAKLKARVSIATLVKYRTMVTPLVSIALRVKRRVLHFRHVLIVRLEKRVTLELTVLNRVLLVQLRPAVPPRVPIVLLVQHRLKAGLQTQNLVVPIALRVKLRDRLPYAPIVLSEKRVPLELTALRRALLVKRHPMVPPHVPFVLPVQSRLQSQQMVVPIALGMHFLCFHSLHAPTAQRPRVPPSLLPGTLLPVPPLQQQELQLHSILLLQNATPVHFLLLVVWIPPIRVHFVTLSTMLLLEQRTRVRPRPIKSLLERMELLRSTNVLRVIIGSRL